MAVDFEILPEPVRKTSGQTEATFREDDELAKLKTSRSLQGALETWRLPRAAQLPRVPGLPLVEAPTTIPSAIPLSRTGGCVLHCCVSQVIRSPIGRNS